MSWRCSLLVSYPSPSPSPTPTPKVLSTSIPTERPPRPSYPYCFWRAVLPALLSLTLSTTTTSAIAIPSLNSPLSLPTTPFSESKSLPLGLLDGRIMPCPSTNPCCISSNPKSSSFAFPWRIPEGTRRQGRQDPVQMLEDAILKTQKNPRIVSLEDTPYGVYLLAEFDGGFGRDVLEFLVKGDVVGYRSMATKVSYVYPFTTALGDSKGQEERLKKIIDQLGWSPTDNVRVAC